MEKIIIISIVAIILAYAIYRLIRKKKTIVSPKRRTPQEPRDTSFYQFIEKVNNMSFKNRLEFSRFLENYKFQIDRWMKDADFRTIWIPMKDSILEGLV